MKMNKISNIEYMVLEIRDLKKRLLNADTYQAEKIQYRILYLKQAVADSIKQKRRSRLTVIQGGGETTARIRPSLRVVKFNVLDALFSGNK